MNIDRGAPRGVVERPDMQQAAIMQEMKRRILRAYAEVKKAHGATWEQWKERNPDQNRIAYVLLMERTMHKFTQGPTYMAFHPDDGERVFYHLPDTQIEAGLKTRRRLIKRLWDALGANPHDYSDDLVNKVSLYGPELMHSGHNPIDVFEKLTAKEFNDKFLSDVTAKASAMQAALDSDNIVEVEDETVWGAD